jgi:hypothetical protein
MSSSSNKRVSLKVIPYPWRQGQVMLLMAPLTNNITLLFWVSDFFLLSYLVSEFLFWNSKPVFIEYPETGVSPRIHRPTDTFLKCAVHRPYGHHCKSCFMVYYHPSPNISSSLLLVIAV